MKKLIFIALLAFAFNAQAQTNAKQDASGNYTAVTTQAEKKPAKETGKNFTDSKGKVYPLMESSKGKLFYVRTSKTGNKYNVYLKLND